MVAVVPELPAALPNGNYLPLESARAIMGRDIIRARRALGWSQAELARRAQSAAGGGHIVS